MSTQTEPAGGTEDRLRQALTRAAKTAFDLDELPAIEIVEPRERGHGDLATNVAMQLARTLKQPPRQIAEALSAAIDVDGGLVRKVEVAGPGFLNFHLAHDFVQSQVADILRAGDAFGRSPRRAGPKTQVEFVSANPTGPVNVVSARAAAVGDTLVRLLDAAGYPVAAEFYVNDAGSQVDLLAESLDAHWHRAQGRDVAIPEQGYHGAYVGELAAAIAADQPLGDLDAAERLALFRRQGLERILAMQRHDLEQFGVTFDRWFLESGLHESGALDRIFDTLRERDQLADREGATWFTSSAWGDDADRVVRRSDGRPTYLLADIAYHADKRARGFERVIDIWGPDHHGHIARMQAAAQALGFGADWLEILIVQQVNLLRDGQPVKMSKRSGTVINLDELESEVGRDPARFFFLMRKVGAHLDFDLELAKRQTEENPCFYVQYGHARVASILARASERGSQARALEDVDLSLLTADAELHLIKRLSSLPAMVVASAEAREPQRMTAYLRDVAADFHRFYHHQRVVGVEEELSQARLALARATQIVLRNGLALLGLAAPDRM